MKLLWLLCLVARGLITENVLIYCVVSERGVSPSPAQYGQVAGRQPIGIPTGLSRLFPHLNARLARQQNQQMATPQLRKNLISPGIGDQQQTVGPSAANASSLVAEQTQQQATGLPSAQSVQPQGPDKTQVQGQQREVNNKTEAGTGGAGVAAAGEKPQTPQEPSELAAGGQKKAGDVAGPQQLTGEGSQQAVDNKTEVGEKKTEGDKVVPQEASVQGAQGKETERTKTSQEQTTAKQVEGEEKKTDKDAVAASTDGAHEPDAKKQQQPAAQEASRQVTEEKDAGKQAEGRGKKLGDTAADDVTAAGMKDEEKMPEDAEEDAEAGNNRSQDKKPAEKDKDAREPDAAAGDDDDDDTMDAKDNGDRNPHKTDVST